ncbi:MAG: VOC family protein [Mesorhizobium sp.]|nr:VOC family protein [Mesorhizobium sp.]MBN9241182.1 VOC family protein [Mesorhizobium sp.]
MTHPLDHLVLPTRDLETARARLGALGFMVAPQGTHPFGTINCCVYFGDGTFMEPLAIGDADGAGQAADAGNVFVGRDRAFRAGNGDDGFSAVVFGTDDADADHARYIASGISAGQRLDFSRPFVDASGKQDTASFRLAFAAAPDMADAFVFACERANAPKVDRTALQRHANGVSAIREVVGVSTDAEAKLRLLAVAAAMPADAVSGNRLALPNADLTLLDAPGFQRRFGVAVMPSSLRFAAVVFAASDVRSLAPRLAGAGIDHHFSGASLVIPPSAGQGATFVFEES